MTKRGFSNMGNKYHIVYKTTNQLNARYYIGVHSTYNLTDRYLGSGLALNNAINKYGRSNFCKVILHTFKELKPAINKEAQLVDEERTKDPLCYNLVPGGGKPPIHEGKSHHFFGKERSNEFKKNHSSKMKELYRVGKMRRDGKHHHLYGKSLSKKHKQALSEAFSGRKNPFYGSTHSKKAKQTMGSAHPDIDVSGSNNPSAKKFKHIPTGRIFKCGKEAAKWANLKYKTFMNRIYQNADCNEFKRVEN